MGKSFNPIFEFKQQFDNGDANLLVSKLIHHPVIWDVLLDKNWYLRIANNLGTNLENWQLDTLLSSLHKLVISEELLFPGNNNSISDELTRIENETQSIIRKRLENISWGEIINLILTDEKPRNEMLRIWGTVISRLAQKNNYPNDLEVALLKSVPFKPLLMAFVIGDNQDNEYIKRFIERNINELVQEPGKIKKIVLNLADLGFEKKSKELTFAFLNHPGIEIIAAAKHQVVNKDNYFELLKKYDDLRILALLIDDMKKAKLFSDKNEELYKRIKNINPIDYYKKEHKSKDTYIGGLKRGSNQQLHTLKSPIIDKGPIRKIKQAFTIEESDPKAAIELCKEVLHDVDVSGFENSFYSPEYGFIIDPITIARLFIRLGLVRESIEILEKGFFSNQGDTVATRFLAQTCAKFGDHERAVKYYSKVLFGENPTRQDNVNLLRSLEYLGLWKEVSRIYENINSLSLEDSINNVVAFYRAGDFEKSRLLSEKLIINFPDNQTVLFLSAILQRKQNAGKSVKQTLEKIRAEKISSIEVIRIIFEYFGEIKDLDGFIQFYEKLSKNIKRKPEVKVVLAKAYLSFGQTERFFETLYSLVKSEDITDQVTAEEILELSNVAEIFNETNGLIDLIAKKWPLSQVIQCSKASYYLENNNFAEAGKILYDLMRSDNISEEIIFLSGCTLLNTTPGHFPYSKNNPSVNNEWEKYIEESIEQLGQEKEFLLTRLVQIELLSKDKLADYTKLLADKSITGNKDYWRISYGLGIHHYKNKQFDKAIAYLNETRKVKPLITKIIDLLVESYSNLRLPDEAVDLLRERSHIEKSSVFSLLKYADILYESEEFLTYLDSFKLEGNRSAALIAKAKVFLKRVDLQNVEKCLCEAEKDKDIRLDYLLPIASLYFHSGSKNSAVRVIGKYLTMKNDLSEVNVLEAASLYFELKEYEKALHLINLLNGTNELLELIKAKIHLAQGDTVEADKAYEKVFQSINTLELQTLNNFGSNFELPKQWKMSFEEVINSITLVKIQTKQIERASEILNKLVDSNPNNANLQKTMVVTALINGSVNDAIFHNTEINLTESILAKAEIALNYGREMEAAKIMTEISEKNKEDIRTRAIQARLTHRSGNLRDAKIILGRLINQYYTENHSYTFEKIQDLEYLLSDLALCDAAAEIGNYSQAFEVIKSIISKIGLTPRISKTYTIIFTKLLENNRLNKKILIKSHNHPINDDDIQIFDDICRDQNNYLELDDWINRAKAVIKDDVKHHQLVCNQTPSFGNLNAIVFSLWKNGRMNDAMNLISEYDHNPKAMLTYAALAYESDPESAQSVLLQLMKENDAEPEILFTLALINKKLNNITDSYAAVSLALEKWPDEFEWENFAGDLNKELGNNHAAYKHYQNAEKNNPRIKYTESITKDNSLFSTMIDDEELIDNRTLLQNLPKIIEMAEDLITQNMVDEVKVLAERVQSTRPGGIELTILDSLIALSSNEYNKAQELIEKVLRISPDNIHAIRIKSNLVLKIIDLEGALSYLDEIIANQKKNEIEAVIIKSNLICDNSGNMQAIKYLSDMKDIATNWEIQLQLAELWYQKGNFKRAQSFAEQAIGQNSQNSNVLRLLGKISRSFGDLDKAIDYFMRSMSNDPFNREVYIELSQSFESRQDINSALEVLQNGIDFLSKDYFLLRYTGLVLYKYERYQRAYSILRIANRINENDSELTRILSILEDTLIMKSQTSKRNVTG